MSVSSSSTRWPEIGFIVFSGLGAGVSAATALLTFASAGMPFSAGGLSQAGTIGVASAFAAMALIGLTALYWGLRRYFASAGLASARPSGRWYLLLLVFPAAVWLGHRVFETRSLPLALAPIAIIPASGTPVLLAILLARRKGPALTPGRAWGLFLGGLWAVPPLALTFEALLLVPMIVLAGAVLALSEEGRQMLLYLSRTAPTLSPDAFLNVLQSLLLNPGVALISLSYVAAFVPAMEEALKTFALWPLLRRRLTTLEAFACGCIAGAGYALFEAFFLTQPELEWTPTVLGRAGATLMHAFATGLVGAGLAVSIRRKSIWPSLGLYTLAVGMHGLWNASALTVGALQLMNNLGGGAIPEQILQLVSLAGLVILVGLGGLAFAGLLLLPGRLRGAAGSDPPLLDNP